ncbi:hypothetical protein [Chromobacterium rhizoryzae]|uniref:hypothetical protein n=1 Tax=Chromobacterium rhizoryzae TaxID=1778675 RepID=UPI001D072E11|nr:hypothetical protein [Chromobacterium rhizoryzae]
MSLAWERFYPFVLSFVLTAVYWRYPLPFPDDVKDLLSASLSFGAITAGFIATAIAILMALPNDSIMASIKSSGFVEDLIRYLRQAFYSSLLFSLFCLVSFLFLKDFKLCLRVFWVFSASMTFLTLHQVANLMLTILRK